jgi:hypothetical protein
MVASFGAQSATGLQRTLPKDALVIVARGGKKDGAGLVL